MASVKALSAGISIVTGIVSVAGTIAYSKGLFYSNTQISELLKKEGKYTLLPIDGIENSKDWNAAWERYVSENKTSNKWEIPQEEGLPVNQAPRAFKEACKRKAKESIKDTNDPKYKDIINYCSKQK